MRGRKKGVKCYIYRVNGSFSINIIHKNDPIFPRLAQVFSTCVYPPQVFFTCEKYREPRIHPAERSLTTQTIGVVSDYVMVGANL